MKKISIALTLVLTLLLVVSLYHTRAQLVTIETVTVEKVHTALYPEQMPDIIPDPMVMYQCIRPSLRGCAGILNCKGGDITTQY